MGKFGLIVRLKAKPGSEEKLKAALSKAIDVEQGNPGTLVYAMHVDTTDQSVFYMYQVFADEDAIQAHRQTPGFAEGIAEIRSLLDGDFEITRVTPIKGKGVAHLA